MSWKWSISVSVLVIWVLIVRILGRKHFNKTVIVTMWNLVILRGLIPIHIPVLQSPFVGDRIKTMASKDTVIIEKALGVSRQASTKYADFNQSGSLTESVFSAWVIGMIMVGLFIVWKSLCEIRALRKIIPIECGQIEKIIAGAGIRRKVKVYCSERFHSPVTCGFLRPKIILPMNFEKEADSDIRNIILHELMHIKRFDVPKRFCMSVVFCIHWFNPLMWVCYWLYRKDQELACDELVLRSMDCKDAKEYAGTLISMSVQKEKEAAFFEGFLKKNTERQRILAAIENRKMGMAGSVAALLVIASSMIVFASYAPKEVIVPVPIAESIEEERPTGYNTENRELFEEENHKREEWLSRKEYYEAILKDIEDNHNDPSQPFTEEQEEAMIYKITMEAADIYLRILERGQSVGEDGMERIEEAYPDRGYMKKN